MIIMKKDIKLFSGIRLNSKTVFWLAFFWLFFFLEILPQNKSIASKEWEEIKGQFKTKFSSNSSKERIEAVKLFEPCWQNFTNRNNLIEAIQLLLDVLSRETDPEVVKAVTTCFGKSSTDRWAVEWLKKNYPSVENETQKLRLIEAIGGFTAAYDESVSLLGNFANDKEIKIRLAVPAAAGKLPFKYSLQLLLMLVQNGELPVSLAALDQLSQMPIYDILPVVELLEREKRSEVKNKIGGVLNQIAGQTYGADGQAWKKWLEQRELKKVSPTDVSNAINKGRDYLLTSGNNVTEGRIGELFFYTLVHAGLDADHPLMKSILDKFMAKKLEQTYNVALLAMALSDLDKVKYQGRLIQCARFLLGNQSLEGHWRYGVPIDDKDLTPVTSPGSGNLETVLTGGDQKLPKKDNATQTVVKKVQIKVPPRQVHASNDWDNSNTQYALLGLWACSQAGIEIPQNVWGDAERHLRQVQNADGGWCYTKDKPSYGSMTAGGLGALVICLNAQGKNVQKDYSVISARKWLEQHFTVEENPSYDQWHYYYLYALERAGVLAETEFFGQHEWYQIGAKYLLSQQKETGCWDATDKASNPIVDTCFAILFLKRATKSMMLKTVITGAEENKKSSAK